MKTNFTGFKEECQVLLEKFRWGQSFLSVNDELFEMYSRCETSADVVKTQESYLKDVQKHKEEKGVEYEGAHNTFFICKSECM